MDNATVIVHVSHLSPAMFRDFKAHSTIRETARCPSRLRARNATLTDNTQVELTLCNPTFLASTSGSRASSSAFTSTIQ
jgi:hypothetical protein